MAEIDLALPLIYGGMVALAISLWPIIGLLRIVQSPGLRGSWYVLATLVAAFIFAYAILSILLPGIPSTLVSNLVGIVLFFGGCFVLAVAALSSRTARDLARMTELEREAIIDPLTKVYNRRFIDRRLSEEVHRAQRHGKPMSLMLVDIDHFKRVNDTHGHQEGDLVLIETSSLLSRTSRLSDIVARFGGEEFVVLAPGTDAGEACDLAERIRESVETNTVVASAGLQLNVTVSIGVAECVADDTVKTLLERADRALYRAKNMGRNRVRLAEAVPGEAPSSVTPIAETVSA